MKLLFRIISYNFLSAPNCPSCSARLDQQTVALGWLQPQSFVCLIPILLLLTFIQKPCSRYIIGNNWQLDFILVSSVFLRVHFEPGLPHLVDSSDEKVNNYLLTQNAKSKMNLKRKTPLGCLSLWRG